MVPWAASLLTLWCWCCCCCAWTQTARTTPGDPPYACPTAPRPLVDFTVNYSLPHFQTARPVQHIQANGVLREVYVASRNVIEGVDQRMKRIWAVPTGPVGLGGCPGGCGPCDAAAVPDEEDTPPEDTDNMVLLLDPAGTLLPYLYYCGSTRHGVCFFLDYGELNPVSQCLYKETSNTEAYCPDCLASPLGTQVIVVEQGRTTLFFVATSVDERVMQRYPRRSLSVLRPLATEDGFHMVMRGLTVLPYLWASYPITYIYTFSTAEYVYFLSLQRENPEKSNSPMQTRLGRLPVLIPEVWMYREVVLECRYEPKRRRRRRGAERNRDVVYNGLQAAYFGPVGGLLAGQLRVNPQEKLLYGTFAEVDEHGVPQKNSAFCTFPLFQVNQAIETGVEDCCTGGTEQLSRGLCHYQPCESCPHEVSISLTHPSRGECCRVEGPEAFCPGDQSNRVNLTVRFKIVLL